MRILIFLSLCFSALFAFDPNIDDRSYGLKSSTSSWNTNWNKHSIPYSELLSGGPARDGIPPLDKPKFVTIKQAKTFLKDDEPLIFVSINNEKKAYALSILIWHEIVNDSLGNEKILVTFCPLCNASIVFSRMIDGVLHDFGTSGLLRKSDLVMYDRQNESLWQQFTGEAIVGDSLGKTLKLLNSSIVSFKDIYTHHPSTMILSQDTGYKREYGKNPYSGYDDINSSPFLLQEDIDDRMPPMRRVATLSINNRDKAYSYKLLKTKKVINDRFENKDLVLFYKNNVLSALDKSKIKDSKKVGSASIFESKLKGEVLEFYYDKGFYDKKTKSLWNIFGLAIEGKLKGSQLKKITFGSHFWFAWVVFKPNTVIYK